MNSHLILEALTNILSKERVSTNETVLELHGRDELHSEYKLPDIVVFPKNKEEISRVVAVANEQGIPITPFGVGSSVEGNALPEKGGITVDFQLMNEILEIRPEDFIVKVQPGVTRQELNEALKKYGLFFPVDPGANATIGGMTATNASGTTSVRYGVMRDQVRGLEVILPDGRIIKTGGTYVKSSAGYNLTQLFVGSEGTLGLFSEITLKVYGIPEHIMAARMEFDTIDDAVQSAVALLSAGIPIARMELVDERAIQQVNIHNETTYKESPNLFVEFHGNEKGLQQDIEFAQEILKDSCRSFEFETDSKKRAKLWEVRHNLVYAFLHRYPKKRMIVTDVSLPLSSLTESILHAQSVISQSGLDGAIVGHVGDGNFHSLLMVDPNNQLELQKADEVNEAIVYHALELGGTCTGEHGVGIGKRKYLRKEHGEALDVMESIKHLLDPKGLLNPGKLFLDRE